MHIGYHRAFTALSSLALPRVSGKTKGKKVCTLNVDFRIFQKKQGKKVTGKVIFREKKAKRVDLKFRGVAANGRSPDPTSE